MEKPMILIAEPVHFADTHVQVNSAFIALLKSHFSANKIVVIAEREHCKALALNATEMLDGVVFQHFEQYSKNDRFYWFRKIWGEWKIIIKLRSLARHQHPELLVWLCLFPTGHLLLQILNRLSFSKQKQLIILHGEMEYFATAPKWLDKILKHCLQCSFKLAKANTSYIVLGGSIKRNLEKLSFLPHKNIFSFPHPFLYSPFKHPKQPDTPLKLCTIGTLKKSKNAHLFFELAQRFSKEIKDGELIFTTIGKMFDDVKPYQNTFVTAYKSNVFLAQKEYEAKIAAQDIALFFYDTSMYQLSASGAFHEAINNRLPIISLQNDYFTDAANVNNAVKCVVTLEEMEHCIRVLIKDKETKIYEYQSALATFIQQNSFLLQSQTLKIILLKSLF